RSRRLRDHATRSAREARVRFRRDRSPSGGLRETAEQERGDREHEEAHEQDLREPRRGAGEGAETEERSEEGDEEEGDGPAEHGSFPFRAARRATEERIAARGPNARLSR